MCKVSQWALHAPKTISKTFCYIVCEVLQWKSGHLLDISPYHVQDTAYTMENVTLIQDFCFCWCKCMCVLPGEDPGYPNPHTHTHFSGGFQCVLCHRSPWGCAVLAGLVFKVNKEHLFSVAISERLSTVCESQCQVSCDARPTGSGEGRGQRTEESGVTIAGLAFTFSLSIFLLLSFALSFFVTVFPPCILCGAPAAILQPSQS